MLDEAETLVKQKVADAKAVEEGKEAAEPVEPAYKYEPKTVTEWAVQNDNKPLWTRSPREVRRMGSEALRSDGVLHLAGDAAQWGTAASRRAGKHRDGGVAPAGQTANS